MPSTAADLMGVIFDWDGVIIDSHYQHERSWFRLAEELGQALTREEFKKTFGMRNQTIIPHHFRWAAPEDTVRIEMLGDRKEEYYREILKEEGIEPLPGVVELLSELKAAGIPCAVGSSTPRKNLDVIMEITGLSGYFQAVATAEDVTRGKPEPDVFLAAARKISREPAHCLVFEDAHVGIEAARRAGMKVIGVATTHAPESLSNANHVVHRLTEVNLAMISEVLGS